MDSIHDKAIDVCAASSVSSLQLVPEQTNRKASEMFGR